MTQQFQVAEEDAGVRLDKFLASSFETDPIKKTTSRRMGPLLAGFPVVTFRLGCESKMDNPRMS